MKKFFFFYHYEVKKRTLNKQTGQIIVNKENESYTHILYIL